MSSTGPRTGSPDDTREPPRQPRSAGRRAGESLGRLDYQRPEYPHDLHPALVPGISIEEQRRRYGLDKVVFAVAGALTVAFVVWGVVSPDSVASVAAAAFAWATRHVGWLFNLVAIVVLVSLLVLAFSPYGKVPLGKDGEEVEFSTFGWVAMLFAAGIGIGVLFWGPSEPLTYFVDPPPMTNEPESTEAMHHAMAQTYFHWGFHAWAMYALVGGAVAYCAYRRGRPLLMSSIFRTLLGKRHTEGAVGKAIDVFAIIATLFGTAAALGIAAMQIGTGVGIVSGSGTTNTLVVVILVVLTAGFILSAVSGVARGIRYLSSINIVLTVGVVGLLLVLGPTLFLLNFLPSAQLEYLGSMVDMMGRSLSWGEETAEFQSTWTVYYWAWWISWSPFVGIFIARISRGRSIRQFVLGTILIPSSLIFVAFGIMGGSSMWQYAQGGSGLSADMPAPEVFFQMVANLPYVDWLPFVIILVLSIFFITSADSASVMMGMLSSRGNLEPSRWVVVFWGLVMSGIAAVMLLLGDATALEGLQQLVIVTAVPFALVMLLIIVAWWRDLHTDPVVLRHRFAEAAVRQAVLDGVERYGDGFALEVVEAVPPSQGAGSGVDSTDERYTVWYQRTDEDGEPVGYDFATDTWEDGFVPDDAQGGSTATRASQRDTDGDD